MKYKINYSCSSHTGKCRSMNQDNYVCDGRYFGGDEQPVVFPLTGTIRSGHPGMIGVFDGMGGEEHGEIAALIAARCAAETRIVERPVEGLIEFCKTANEMICDYAEENDVFSMGTTAAMLVFSKREIALCNIGDSKIFRLSNGELRQLSVDHYAIAAYGLKPPLSQNLGIPASEMAIEPHVAEVQYNNGDLYLICSDGLTDMVTEDAITGILSETEFEDCVSRLQETALENGGKDNITIILCKVEREKSTLFSKLFLS